MARGGKRDNAGRKSKSRELLIERSRSIAVNAKLTPLEFLMNLLQDVEQPLDRRFTAAVAAAPYVHPRLSNSTLTTTHKRSVDEYTTAELIAALEQDARSTGTAEAEEGNGDAGQIH